MFESSPQYEHLLARCQLVCFMLGMGATLSLHEFARVAQKPRSLLVGAACQFLITPLIAVLINRLGNVEPGVAVGLVLIAAMPGGAMSKLFAFVGRGNLALSITLTACGTLAALVTVPLLLRLLASGYIPDEFEVPVGEVVQEVAVYLILPLLAGMALARRLPLYRHPFSRWCFRLGCVVVFVMVVGSLGSGRIRPDEYGWQAPAAIILFCLVSQQVSMLPFRLLRWPRPDCLSVGIEVTMRNLNLALLLLALVRDAFVVRQHAAGLPALDESVERVLFGIFWAILYYAGVALGAGLVLALSFRHRARRAALREQAAQVWEHASHREG